MPTRSSDIGTEQESGKREVEMTSKRAVTEPTPDEAVAEPTLEEAEATIRAAFPEKITESLKAEAKAIAAADPEAVEAVEPDPVAEPVAETTEEKVTPVLDATDAPVLAEILADGRERMDAIDDQILELVARRMEVAGVMLVAKHERRINPRDKLRQEEILVRLNGLAADFNPGVSLNNHQIRELYELLIRLGVENFRKNIIDARR